MGFGLEVASANVCCAQQRRTLAMAILLLNPVLPSVPVSLPGAQLFIRAASGGGLHHRFATISVYQEVQGLLTLLLTSELMQSLQKWFGFFPGNWCLVRSDLCDEGLAVPGNASVPLVPSPFYTGGCLVGRQGGLGRSSWLSLQCP